MNSICTMPERAMVLAAGLGTRMRPLTDQLPKPLLKVAGKPLLDYTLDLLEEAGVRDVVVNTHYLAPLVQDYLKDRRRPRIIISHETQLLETGGGIVKALPLLGEGPFFSANSDVIVRSGAVNPFARLAAAWQPGMQALLLLQPREQAFGYAGKGDFFLNGDATLRRRGDAAEAPYVFTGVQLMSPGLLAGLPEEPFSLNRAYDARRQPDGTLPAIYGMVHDGEWLHTGDPESLRRAEARIAA